MVLRGGPFTARYRTRRRGDYEGNLAEAERALTISPNLAGAHAARGASLISAGRLKEGVAALERSIRLDPADRPSV